MIMPRLLLHMPSWVCVFLPLLWRMPFLCRPHLHSSRLMFHWSHFRLLCCRSCFGDFHNSLLNDGFVKGVFRLCCKNAWLIGIIRIWFRPSDRRPSTKIIIHGCVIDLLDLIIWYNNMPNWVGGLNGLISAEYRPTLAYLGIHQKPSAERVATGRVRLSAT